MITRENYEYIFPELKESEDERIRKEIKDFFSRIMLGQENFLREDYDWNAWIAWLEKQGSQNLANSAKTCKDGQNTVVAIPKFRVGDVIRPKGSTTEYTIESISGGCYRGNLWRLPIGCDDDYELVEQKPAELPKGEDYGIDSLYHAKIILEKTLGKVDGYQSDDGILEHKCAISAVKKLYEQKPTGWSEEDEEMLNSFLHKLEVCDLLSNKECLWIKNKLKALKQNTWKPSERQKEALLWCVVHLGGADKQTLGELLEELNKL